MLNESITFIFCCSVAFCLDFCFLFQMTFQDPVCYDIILVIKTVSRLHWQHTRFVWIASAVAGSDECK